MLPTSAGVEPATYWFFYIKVGFKGVIITYIGMFSGVYIMFLISAQNIDCGYSLKPPHRGGSNEYPQSMFLNRNMKNIRLFI